MVRKPGNIARSPFHFERGVSAGSVVIEDAVDGPFGLGFSLRFKDLVVESSREKSIIVRDMCT